MWFIDRLYSVAAAAKLHVKNESKKTVQKRTAQHSPKKSSKTPESDGRKSLENNGVKVDEAKQKTDIMSSLSVDTTKVCSLLSCCAVTLLHLPYSSCLDCTQKDTLRPWLHVKQAVVRGTTNPPPAATYATDLLTPVLCCHLANATDSELWPVITNNLTFDPPTRLPKLTQN